MIPTGPEHINRIARTLEEVTNITHILGPPTRRDPAISYEAALARAREDERFRSFAPGELVRIKDIKPPAVMYGDRPSAGPGLARVLIEPLHPDARKRAFYALANELELVDDAAALARAVEGFVGPTAWVTGPGRVVETPDGKLHFMTDVYAQRLQHAHADVSKAYGDLANALNTLKSIQKEADR